MSFCKIKLIFYINVIFDENPTFSFITTNWLFLKGLFFVVTLTGMVLFAWSFILAILSSFKVFCFPLSSISLIIFPLWYYAIMSLLELLMALFILFYIQDLEFYLAIYEHFQTACLSAHAIEIISYFIIATYLVNTQDLP